MMKMQLCILRAIKNWRVHRLVFYVESNKKFKWKKTKNWLAWSIPVRMNDLWRQLGSPKRNLPKRVYPHKWFLQNLARKRESQVPSLMPYYTAVTFKMWSYSPKIAKKIIFYLRVRLSVCLSVCQQDYSKTRAWIWMKCCVSTDVGTWMNWFLSPIRIIVRMPEPDCFLRYALQRGFLLRRQNPTYRYWAPIAAATRGFKMVLFTASRGNNFVGGTCAPPSALLVVCPMLCMDRI